MSKTVVCEYCNESFEESEAFDCIEDDLGFKTYWCSSQCLESSKEAKGCGKND